MELRAHAAEGRKPGDTYGSSKLAIAVPGTSWREFLKKFFLETGVGYKSEENRWPQAGKARGRFPFGKGRTQLGFSSPIQTGFGIGR